ncbi:MAG: ATP-dependent DNA helicase [Deltaproteobacteria bacterium]|nr:ATP-dependent DNA helicase [Deltaproteobacteria bacterium]
MSPGGRGRRLRFDDAERRLELGVHELLDLRPVEGDLRLSVAWGARARLAAGQELHQRWAAARTDAQEDFLAERSLTHRLIIHGWEVRIRGRLDGLSAEGGWWVVEELKSTTLPAAALGGARLSDLPAAARQVQLYLHLISAGADVGLALDRDRVVGRLVLRSLLDGSQRVLPVPPDPGMGPWLERLIAGRIADHEERLAHRARLRGRPVPLPHPMPRPGQEELIDACTAAFVTGQTLLAEAPTGHGKTAAALTAAVRRAVETGQRVFFATMRTTQQRMAEETAQRLAAGGLPLRALTLRAREKACLQPVLRCRPDACPYAAGFFDKVEAGGLRAAALVGPPGQPGQVGGAWLGALGRAHMVCPHGLGQELLDQVDVVIGDVNHVFDPMSRSAAIWAEPESWLVIIDEAHHLPERAMDWGSPRLPRGLIAAARAADPAGSSAHAPFQAFVDEVEAFVDGLLERAAGGGLVSAPLTEGLDRRELRALADRAEGLALDRALVWSAPLAADPVVAAPAQVDEAGPDEAPPEAALPPTDPWVELARALLRLRAAADRAGPETLLLARAEADEDGPAGLALLCRDPSALLGPAFAALGGAVCLSATLRPARFFADLLGLPPTHRALSLPSPFPPEHLRVAVLPQVSTEARRRARDRLATAALISEAIAAVPGNVAVFFPSFAMLEDLAPLLRPGPAVLLVQRADQRDGERAALLEALRGPGRHALLAVLGGGLAEGVDLPGDALLGAVIVSPGLPPPSPERRLLADWYEERFGAGRRYAYLVPGLTRVVQAAGRVIRGPEDRGVVFLLCQRFLRDELRALLPPTWTLLRGGRPGSLTAGLFSIEGAPDPLAGLALPPLPPDLGEPAPEPEATPARSEPGLAR